MRRIWDKNCTDEFGRQRVRFGKPWLVENFQFGGEDDRVKFDHLYPRHGKDIPLWERFQRFRQSAKFLYDQAVGARHLAMSYRNFNVGSSALAFSYSREHSYAWSVHNGMNTKHGRNMRPICSETIAVNAAHAYGCELIIGIVVVGNLREEDIDVIETLHPCQDCRWFMHGHPLIDGNTLVLTAMPPENGGFAKREIRTVKQLLSLHKRISGDDFSQ
jgi:cytidine deaminase